MNTTDFSPLFRFLQLFKAIPKTDIEIISEQITYRNIAANEILLREGKIAREMFFICSGILKIVTIKEKGNVVTQFFLKENYFCTILNSFINRVPAHESIVAAYDGGLIVFTQDKLQYLYHKLPYFEELIDSITKQALLDKIATRNSYMGEDASTRYRKFIQRQPDIALRVPLSDVASYLGITRQSLSRIRRTIK